MYKNWQFWLILGYMKKHPNKQILASDFVNPSIFSNKPYIWYSASARLSKLYKMGLINMVWYKKWKIRFFKKSRDRKIWKINKEWLEYKLR